MRFRLLLALALALAACSGVTDPSAPPWRRVASVGPAARWGHAAVYDAKRDRMIVFAGQSGGGELADVWALDLASETWTQLATGPGPAPRVNPAAVVDPTHDRMIVVGGRTGLATLFDDVWALDLGTLQWTELAHGPGPRQRAHYATDGTHAWFYGGEGFLSVFGDLWQLDFSNDAWTELPNAGDAPPSRTCGAMAFVDGALFVNGGHDVAFVRDGTWRYDSRERELVAARDLRRNGSRRALGVRGRPGVRHARPRRRRSRRQLRHGAHRRALAARRRAFQPLSHLVAAGRERPRVARLRHVAPKRDPVRRNVGRRTVVPRRRLGPPGRAVPVIERALGAALVLGCAGCMSFTTLGRARTVERKRVELFAAPELRATATLDGDPTVRPAGEIGVRYGVADRVDVGARVGESGGSVTTRVQLVRSASRRSGVDLLIAPGVAYTLTDKLALELPLAIGFNLPGENQIVLAPRAVYQMRFGVGGLDHPAQFVFVGLSAGFVWQLAKHVALAPEIAVLEGVYSEPGFTSFTQAGPALQGALGVFVGSVIGGSIWPAANGAAAARNRR